jgi:hypothetical protein
MIPDKNLFIVTSSLKPAIGVYNDDERFSQTVASLKSIRKILPDAIILFVDVSVRPVSQLEKETLASLSNYYLDLSEEPNTRYCAINGLKSHGENCLLFATLAVIKNDENLSKLLSSVKRIFKFSARSELEDNFDIKEYENLFGKYVFKKRIPTWTNDTKFGADHLLITRMYSFCTSLVDSYLGVLQKNLNLLSNGITDTEHAHYVNIPKEYLVEFDNIKCWGWLAGNGKIEHY